jgi:hypothetical protein
MNNSNQLQRIYFNVVEAAYALNVSKAQVQKWINKGMLPIAKPMHDSGVGTINRTLIHRDDLEFFAAKFKGNK